jgi:hypothetical protein
VGAVMVVEVQPGGQRPGPGGFGGVDPHVGPFDEQGPGGTVRPCRWSGAGRAGSACG